MIKKVSSHLERLAAPHPAIKTQFYPSARENRFSPKALVDPLQEEKFSPVKGLCHKYARRVLIELSLDCASFCRFCTRRRKVSDIKRGKLKRSDVARMVKYIKTKPDVNEVVISGGDPLMDEELLIYALRRFYGMSRIKIIRLHTRIP